MFKRKGGGSKAFRTMLKKTALFLHGGFPKWHCIISSQSCFQSRGSIQARLRPSTSPYHHNYDHSHNRILFIILSSRACIPTWLSPSSTTGWSPTEGRPPFGATWTGCRHHLLHSHHHHHDQDDNHLG